jgi:hypothetical protein
MSSNDLNKTFNFSDYIIYVDESGDHGLSKIDGSYPVFVLVFTIFNIKSYIEPTFRTPNPPMMRQLYQRLCASGKAKKTALIAVMRKLLITMNALIRKTMWPIFEQRVLD